ncbi:amylo-alpha-1,6-glucosidase [Microbacterium soli]|uniref:Glycogen debranching N-terminal domain-containing protein n=1 Tax=Microbacterium soli TaxID=446075 RepID=A0ABP7MJR8_9MICO
MMTNRPVSPSLIDAMVLLASPTQLWSDRAGDVDTRSGFRGLIHADRRRLATWSYRVPGDAVEVSVDDAVSKSTVVQALRGLDDETKDPRLLLTIDRRLGSGSLEDHLAVENATDAMVRVPLVLEAVIDDVPLWQLRAGIEGDRTSETVTTDGDTVRVASELRWLEVQLPGADVNIQERADGLHVRAEWVLEVPAGSRRTERAIVHVGDSGAAVAASSWSPPQLPTGGDTRLERWAQRATAELRGLATTLAEGQGPFIAAGAPWYLTLFGRDAIWSALMLMPYDTEIARGTVAALAATQATTRDAAAQARPGAIVHELRGTAHGIPREGLQFPSRYYGTIDATPLWIRLLYALEQAEGAAATIEHLPALVSAITWLTETADGHPEGFLRYMDSSGTGLVNQGWKDSSDAVRFADGRIASGPVALVEVQGYLHEALCAAAELCERHGLGGHEEMRDRASRLRDSFRERFWVERDGVRYPALALDGHDAPVDALSSNIGHLLGTGLLTTGEEREIASLLMHPTLRTGFGLRTLATTCAGYWPLSYHCGSVWPHDTAIAVSGLERAGFHAEALLLADELLAQAEVSNWRLQELVGGRPRSERPNPERYPTSCFPQAWAAASVAVVAQIITGASALPHSAPVDSGNLT